MIDSTRKKIEFYLYNYNYIDTRINTIISNKADAEYKQNYTRYIKNKSSALEDQVIRNIGLEKRILKIKKWQRLIKTVLERYKQSDKLKYSFIILKYFDKKNSIIIENKLGLSFKKQKNIQNEILEHIFLVAIKNNILSM